MRFPSIVIALSFVAALAAGGCKKAEEKKVEAPKVAEPKVADTKVVEPAGAVKADQAAVPKAGALTLQETPAQVGDKRTRTDDITVAFQFDLKGKKIDAKSVEHKEETTEVLAVDGKVASKVKLTYAKLSAVQTMAGKDTAKTNVLDGKSYVVWVEGGAVKATTADGAAVSAEELAELASKNDDLGKPDVIGELLAARSWVIGQTYDLTADDLARVKARSANPDKPMPTAMSFTLQAFDDKEARFAMTTTLVQTKATEELTFTMKGTARVELPSNRGLEMSMAGVLTGSIKSMPTTGTMEMKTLYTY